MNCNNNSDVGDIMVIYLDVLIVINFFITYFSLKGTAALLHAGYRTGRIIAAAVIGGFSSLSALLNLGFLPSFTLKILVTGIITFIAFGWVSPGSFAMRTIVTAVAGALVCGVTIMLRDLTGSSFFSAAGGYPYLDISVIHLIISTTAVYVIISLYRRLTDRPRKDEMLKLIICKNNISAELSAYPDSGNNLRDFLTGTPVIVCRKSKINSLIPKDRPEKLRIIPFSSVGGKGFITAFRADSIMVCRENGQRTQIEALVGADEGTLENEDFDAIINPKIIV